MGETLSSSPPFTLYLILSLYSLSNESACRRESPQNFLISLKNLFAKTLVQRVISPNFVLFRRRTDKTHENSAPRVAAHWGLDFGTSCQQNNVSWEAGILKCNDDYQCSHTAKCLHDDFLNPAPRSVSSTSCNIER